MRIIDTKIDRPKAPSQTENTKNTINIYKSYSINNKYNIKIKKILNTIYSNLNKTINKCLCLETKIKFPIKNIKIIIIYINIIIIS